VVFLHCPDVVGKYCNFAAVSNEYPDEGEELKSTTVKNYGKYEPGQYDKKSVARSMGEGYLNQNRQASYGGTDSKKSASSFASW
jgi:hypothetical protein